MGNIAIVSCTSSDLTPEQAAALGVRLVPLKVTFGDETFDTVTELTNEQFYEKLTAPGAPFPRTSAVNPAQFESTFREALDEGAAGVVCITISQDMSATYSAAVQAAEAIGAGVVKVIDSRTVTQAQGLIVKRAADLAGRTRLLFTPETLEYLQKGGRIGRASALLGSVLSIKPILGVEDGVVTTVDKKRTSAKARARLLEIIADYDAEEVAVLHTGVPDLQTYREQVAQACGRPVEELEVGLAGPVAGSHVGPGMVGASLILTG